MNLSPDLLPDHVWEMILSYIPISTAFRMKAVSRKFSSIIRSRSFRIGHEMLPHDDLYFLLFADFSRENVVFAYDPNKDKWLLLSLSFMFCSGSAHDKLRRVLASHGTFVLLEDRKGFMIIANLFTRSSKILPQMTISARIRPYVLAVIDLQTSFKIVAVTTADTVSSQIYDSLTNSWNVTGIYMRQVALLGSSVYLDGFLFCLCHNPDSLLCFELSSGTWSEVDASLPSVHCPHLLVHDGSLVLIGGIEADGAVKNIGIWKMDKLSRSWDLVYFMPDHLFRQLGSGILNQFNVVACKGKVCFCKRGCSQVLMHDMSEKIWRWLPSPPVQNFISMKSWFGHSVEPRFDALI